MKHLEFADQFALRHIGPREKELESMLQTIEADSLDALIDQTIPKHIRLEKALDIDKAISEFELLQSLREIANLNKSHKSFIGLGYYQSITPTVILRNIFENPSWYTQYTPYQSEIAQGRLEALLNFQTMVTDLTGLEIANSSLLDEATAAAEAMTMLFRLRSKKMAKANVNAFFVSHQCFPQTIDVLKTRAEPLDIKLIIGDANSFAFDTAVFGCLLQYPSLTGKIDDYSSFVEKSHSNNALVAVAVDLMSLTLLSPPGEWGADIAVGNSQVFGVPMGYGGPHAAFLAGRNSYKRHFPGRIVGVSHDRHGKKAYRLAMQTREQHIRREKATSNICTAQVLLAIMASMYAVYHGPKGLKAIAQRIYQLTNALEKELQNLDYKQVNEHYFNTLRIKVSPEQQAHILQIAQKQKINFYYIDKEHINISIDQATTKKQIQKIVSVFAKAKDKTTAKISHEEAKINWPKPLMRQSDYLTHEVFNRYHCETEMMRYIKKLENRDLSLTTSMISLGSCTMKLNSATEMEAVSWPEFGGLHPFIPQSQAKGYKKIFTSLEEDLATITGFAATSLQPNSGAQGEYAGLMVIRAYHLDRGEKQRNIVLIPTSAHGTNPASASLAGMKVVLIKCDSLGNIDVKDLEEKASAHSKELSTLMITYPSTHGVFEEEIKKICDIVHRNNGQVYMDGANMNAQVGLTNPYIIGADVCHLNLHKTFSIPHGGGGPGMGPICVAKHLAPYLPGHPLTKVGGEKATTAISAAPWGSPSILLISYAYIKMLGKKGVTQASKYAILNANYIKNRLEKHFTLLYSGKNNRVAHEMIIDMRPFKSHITVEDVAKRLMDYNYHAPTVSFPVPETMMIEPTESESKEELDRFCDALIAIRAEIQEVIDGKADAKDNVLKNAPHTAEEVTSDDWNHSYSRTKAIYPLDYIKENKFWPPVARIDNVYGDRNLICNCPPLEAYE